MLESEHRLLTLLERLFAIAPTPVDVVLSQCADLIGSVTGSEKVDAFLHDVLRRDEVRLADTERDHIVHCGGDVEVAADAGGA